MAKEKKDFRANMEELNRLFPDHLALSLAEVAQAMKCSEKTVRRNMGHLIINRRIMKTALARHCAETKEN